MLSLLLCPKPLKLLYNEKDNNDFSSRNHYGFVQEHG